MEHIIEIIQTIGFPIACVLCLGFAYYKDNTRAKDEAKEREDKLIVANTESSKALTKVADTIEKSDNINQELAETNRLLIDKMEGELNTINNNVEKVLDKLDA